VSVDSEVISGHTHTCGYKVQIIQKVSFILKQEIAAEIDFELLYCTALMGDFFVCFYALISKIIHHQQFSLENYSCDFKNRKMCNNSQIFGLESGKRAALG
jgi:hypothetical protein